MVHRLQNEIKKLTIELIKARDQQDDHIRHLRTLEKALEKMERQKEAAASPHRYALPAALHGLHAHGVSPGTRYAIIRRQRC